jgi:hypothetical protein
VHRTKETDAAAPLWSGAAAPKNKPKVLPQWLKPMALHIGFARVLVALGRRFFARLRASFAMLVIVLGTLRCTLTANVGRQFCEVTVMDTVAGHHFKSRSADVSAVQADQRTLDHVSLTNIVRSTVGAGVNALF